MTIASEITKLNTNLTNAYTAVDGKGGTLPQAQNFDNLATAISSIPSGSSPTLITKSITVNGTYNASSDNADGYSSVTVNVSGGGGGIGITREVKNGVYQMPTTSFTFSLPNDATDVGNNGLYYAFEYCTGLTSVDLSSLTKVSGNSGLNSAFYGCTGLTSVDLSSLTTVSGRYGLGYAFRDCTGLTSVDLSSLTTISSHSAMYYAFIDCTGLTTMDLSSLTTVSGSRAMYSAFSGCMNLSNISFPSLETIGINDSTFNCSQFAYAFYNCDSLTTLTFPELTAIYCTGGTSTDYGTFANNNKIQKMYFPKLTTITYGEGASTTNQNACKNIFYGCSSLTELHFAAANQAAIEASPGYATAWGRGTGNVTIYFDL